jgi:1-acyl-sn-glycerol-3-phosphate acyltransferase
MCSALLIDEADMIPSLFAFMGTSKDVFIVLKQSLKWVPIIGWVRYNSCYVYILANVHCLQGMRFFNFIFLARSWESDRKSLTRSLARLGQRAEDEDLPFSFLFFPEGTVVSKDTRPRSKKYADKEGIVRIFILLYRRG